MDFVEYVEDTELSRIWPIIRQLRNHLTEDIFRARTAAARKEGYRLYGIEVDGAPRGAIGWRLVSDLASGRSLYIDDLVVDESARGRRFGQAMIEFAKQRAIKHDCEAIRLTSNLQRTGAHAFYQRVGFDRRGYSFYLSLAR